MTADPAREMAVEGAHSVGRDQFTPDDPTEQQHCAAIVERAVTDLGGVDILVNNAAYQMSRDGIASLTTEQMGRTYRTNVFAMVWLCCVRLSGWRCPSGDRDAATCPTWRDRGQSNGSVSRSG